MIRILLSHLSQRFLQSYLLTLTLLVLFVSATFQRAAAQCVGPFQVFESINSPISSMPGWSISSGSNISTNGGRSGLNYWSSSVLAEYIETPPIADVSTFRFWMRRTSTLTIFYDLQINDGFNGWLSLNDATVGATNRARYNVIGTPLFPSVGIPYQEVSVTFGNAPVFPYRNDNVRFRIVDSRTGGVASFRVDDISWTSKTAGNNTIVIPTLSVASAVTSCTQTMTAGQTLTFYDNGGASDNYMVGQDNTVVFQGGPTDKIEVTFNSPFNTEVTNDYLNLHDGPDTTISSPHLLLPIDFSGTSNPSPVTYTSAGTALTFRFRSDVGNVTASGFNITVKCKAEVCADPPALFFTPPGGVSHDRAFLTWTASSSAPPNYEIYYSLTNSPPTAVTPPNGGTPAGLSATVTGLSPFTPYYFWVRAACSGSVKSGWVGGLTATTLCAPQTVTYVETFNGLVGGALPACTFATDSSWSSNSANGNLFGNGVGQSFFTQGVTLTAGTLYRLSYDVASNLLGNVNMQVFYGNPVNNTAATVANIADNIASNSGVNAIQTNVVNFTPSVTGTYYFRFLLQSRTGTLGNPDGNVVLNLDNIKVELENCLPPTFDATSPTAPAVSAAPYVTALTDFGATITWNVPTTGAASNGYLYFISSSPTAPNFGSTASGSSATLSTVLNTLSPSTRYYVWVRGNCGGQLSAWSPTYVTFVTTGSVPIVVPINSTPNPRTITCGTVYTFTDSSSTGDYALNENFTLAFVPSTGTSKLLVEFNTFDTENRYDGLMIYNGNGVVPANLISSNRTDSNNLTTCPVGAFSGTQSPGTIVSTAADGALTFQFRSDNLVNRPGWTARITCIDNPQTITNFTPADNGCGSTGISVVINGTNFTGITKVTFNGVQTSSFSVNTGSTQITTTLPAGASTGKIRVFRGSYFVTSATDFSVNSAAPVTTGAIVCSGTNGTMSSSTACDVIAGSSFNGLYSAALQNKRPDGNFTSCGTFTAAATYRYVATPFTVTVSGQYIFQTNGTFDYFAYITSGGFTPGTCATGTLLASDDDSAGTLQPRLTVTLTAGVTYTLFTTTFAAGVPFPDYTWTISGSAGGSVILLQAGKIQWYTAATGGSLIGEGSPFNPVILGSVIENNTSIGNYIFYAACSTNPNCRTATSFVISAPTPGTATVTGSAATSQSICVGAPQNLVLTGNAGVVTKWQYASDAAFTGGGTDIASSNSNTLTTAQIGTFTGARYFKAQVAVGSCLVTSNVVTITISKTTWNGTSWSNDILPNASIGAVFAGDYNSIGNLSACGVEVLSGNVVFNTGLLGNPSHSLTVQERVLVTGGTLTFEDQSSLHQPNDVVNANGVYSGGNMGNITYKRKSARVLKFDYTYWSTPVFPQNLLAVSPLSPTNLFFDYTTQWNALNAATTTMTPAKGYIFRAPLNYPVLIAEAIPFPASFFGVPNNGTITVPILASTEAENLLGNPYPSALSADLFLSVNTNLGGTLYFWTHNTGLNAQQQYEPNDYALYNLLGGTGTASTSAGLNNTIPSGKIASGQGFFVRGLSNGVATFKNTMRIAADNNQFFRAATANTTSTLEKNRYWLNMSNTEGAFKQALVGYVDGATTGLDRLYDGELVDIGNAVTLYTMVETTKLSIQGRPMPFEVNETIPLGYKSTIASSYTIAIPQVEGIFVTQNIYLEDLLLNVIHDLKTSPYTFVTTVGTFENRFRLRYTTSSLSTNPTVFNENTVIVYKNEAGLHIQSGTINLKNVALFDIQGRAITTQKQINNRYTKFSDLHVAQQVLVVKIEGENGAIVTKKVVF